MRYSRSGVPEQEDDSDMDDVLINLANISGQFYNDVNRAITDAVKAFCLLGDGLKSSGLMNELCCSDDIKQKGDDK